MNNGDSLLAACRRVYNHDDGHRWASVLSDGLRYVDNHMKLAQYFNQMPR